MWKRKKPFAMDLEGGVGENTFTFETRDYLFLEQRAFDSEGQKFAVGTEPRFCQRLDDGAAKIARRRDRSQLLVQDQIAHARRRDVEGASNVVFWRLGSMVLLPR
jgi:hypothetical protein